MPLLLSPDGRRLSKRDRDLDLGVLRQSKRPEEILGLLAHWAGLLPAPEPISAQELIPIFDWSRVPPNRHNRPAVDAASDTPP